MFRAGITRKISLLTIGLISVVAFSVTFVIDHAVSNVLQKNALSLQSTALQDTLNQWGLELAQLRQDVEIISSSPNLGDLIATGYSQESRERLTKTFQNYMINHPDYMQIRYIGIQNNGKEVVRVDRSADGQITTIEAQKLQIKGDRSYFQDTIKLHKGEIFISNIELNREYGKVSQPPTSVIRASTPIYNSSDELVGIFIINKFMSDLLDRFDATTYKDSILYITDSQGRFLLHPIKGKAFDFEYGQGSRIADLYPDIFTASLPRHFSEFEIAAAKDKFVQWIDMPLSHGDPSSSFISFIVETPTSIIEEPARKLHHFIVFVTLSIIGLCLPICMLFSKYITSPLRDIESAAIEIGQGNFETELPISRKDEIGNLARSIKKMAGDIKQNLIEKEKIIRLEQERHLAVEASNAKSEFLANMSHELRTPLNSIIGLTKIILDENRMDREQGEMMKVIDKASSTLLATVNDILDISKIEAGAIKLEDRPFNLAGFLFSFIDQIKPLASQKGLLLTENIENLSFINVRGDELRLSRILMNLASNAIKYTPSGSVAISARIIPADQDSIKFVCSVKDTGIGIPADKLEYIFEKFSQAEESIERRFGGTGLGLNITKQLVEMMGGTIRVQSEEGKGSLFTVSIPFLLVDDQKDQDRKSTKSQRTSNPKNMKYFGSLSVLVADDYEFNQILIRKMIERLNCTDITFVTNGADAVSARNKRFYDLIFMDCHMPKMDGYEATRVIRAFEEQSKGKGAQNSIIIAVTADAMLDTRGECLSVGMDDYLSKPIDEIIFRDMLQKFFSMQDNGKNSRQKPNKKSKDIKPPCDLSILKGYTKGDEAMEKELISVFLDKTSNDLDNMKKNLQDGENKTWVECAHGLKGTSAYVGAKALQQLCLQAEGMLTASAEERSTLYKAIKSEHSKVCKFLKKEGLLP